MVEEAETDGEALLLPFWSFSFVTEFKGRDDRRDRVKDNPESFEASPFLRGAKTTLMVCTI